MLSEPRRRSPQRHRSLVGLVVLIAVLALGAGGASAASSDEVELYNLTNGSRANAGLGALDWDEAAANVARSWSTHMAASGSLSHNPNLASEVSAYVTNQWTRLGENVAVGYSASAIHSAFMSSSAHRNNILGDYNRVGIGVAVGGDGRLWVTVVFIKGPSLGGTRPSQPPAAPPVPVPTAPMLYERNALSTGVADTTFAFGDPGDVVLVCDWNGDGIDSPAVFRWGRFLISNTNAGTVADLTLVYGAQTDVPVCGDWDGDGDDTIGVFRGGTFYLSNSNTSGNADIVAGFGNATDLPTIGDWDGNGKDSIGVFRNGTFFLTNNVRGGFATAVIAYGNATDRPTVGDWNNDSVDTLGIFRNGTLYLRNTNQTGVADYQFAFGNVSDLPIIGDWNGDGVDSLGVVR